MNDTRGIMIHSFLGVTQSKIEPKSEFLVKNETMFFNADPLWVLKQVEHQCPITMEFLYNLIAQGVDLKDSVLDTRVHMLKVGWLPCIGGWHHDDVPRTLPNGQPDYDNEQWSEHYLSFVYGDDKITSPTEFALGSGHFEWHKESTYKHFNRQVEVLLDAGTLSKRKGQSGEIYKIDQHTWHRGTKSEGSGWRWFGRLSKNTERTKNITNEVRRQVNVYVDNHEVGW